MKMPCLSLQLPLDMFSIRGRLLYLNIKVGIWTYHSGCGLRVELNREIHFLQELLLPPETLHMFIPRFPTMKVYKLPY